MMNMRTWECFIKSRVITRKCFPTFCWCNEFLVIKIRSSRKSSKIKMHTIIISIVLCGRIRVLFHSRLTKLHIRTLDCLDGTVSQRIVGLETLLVIVSLGRKISHARFGIGSCDKPETHFNRKCWKYLRTPTTRSNRLHRILFKPIDGWLIKN